MSGIMIINDRHPEQNNDLLQLYHFADRRFIVVHDGNDIQTRFPRLAEDVIDITWKDCPKHPTPLADDVHRKRLIHVTFCSQRKLRSEGIRIIRDLNLRTVCPCY